jgi:two-component system phosphate regulon sensor histidine kinase PhoR
MISRRALTIAVIAIAPLAIVANIAAGGWVRWASLVCAALAVALFWIYTRSLSSRIERLSAFVNRILEPKDSRPRVPLGSDELGELTRSLLRLAPRIDRLFQDLNVELGWREAILSSMTEGVLAVDRELNISFCNRAFLDSIRCTTEVKGLPLIKVARDPELFQLMKKVVDTAEPAGKRLRLLPSEAHIFEVHAAPLTHHSDRGAIAILLDVTPQERLERVKRDFIANVSHEIRTPLATIRGYAETLLDGGLEDERNRRRFVEIIQANGVRLNNIAADLLTLSELESGRTDVRATALSVNNIVQAAVRAIQPAAGLNDVHVEVGPIPDVQVLGYQFRLEQALLNLLDNAVKFNRKGGEVRVQVQARQDTGSVEIRISDTGIGIPSEDLSRIFERFYRVDKARSREVGGTGLGLSIVKHAVEQMQGSVQVESQVGAGSVFIITLPQIANQQAVLNDAVILN